MSNQSNCFIKVDNEFIEVVDGYVVDPDTKKKTQLEFFCLSNCNKLVHLDFEDALSEIQNVLKHHVCKTRRKNSNSNPPEYFSLLCRQMEILNKKVDEIYKQQHNQSIQNRETLVESALVNSHNIQSDSSTNISTISNINTQIVNGEIQEQDTLPSKVTPVIETEKQQTCVRNLLNKETIFFISAEDLKIIGKWASENRDFIPYKGMLTVPQCTFEQDDNYFLKFICSLNPTVVLERIFYLDSQKSKSNTSDHAERTGDLSQEEFVKVLGLTHRKFLPVKDQNQRLRRSNAKRHGVMVMHPIGVTLSNSVSSKVAEKTTVGTKTDYKKTGNSDTKSNSSSSDSASTTALKSNQKKTNKAETLPVPDRILRPLKQRNSHMIKDKTPYSTQEDRVVINWVLKDSNSIKVNGNTIWRELEKRNLMPTGGRSWQSLRNRFLKTILSQLKNYGLHKEDLSKIIRGAQKGSIHRKTPKPIFSQNYGLVIKKATKENEPKQGDSKKADKRISPTRMSYRDHPRNCKKTQIKKGVSVYSDSDALGGDAINKTFSKYKMGLENTKNVSKSRETRSSFKSKRKLFTMGSFVSSYNNASRLNVR